MDVGRLLDTLATVTFWTFGSISASAISQVAVSPLELAKLERRTNSGRLISHTPDTDVWREGGPRLRASRPLVIQHCRGRHPTDDTRE